MNRESLIKVLRSAKNGGEMLDLADKLATMVNIQDQQEQVAPEVVEAA